MCHVCGEQRETSSWLVCRHSSSRRKQGCTYKVHCHCIGIYYTSVVELAQVPFYCPKHGQNRKKASEYFDIPLNPPQARSSISGVNGRQMVERSESGSVLVRDSNAPLGSEVIHVIDSTTGLRSAVRVDSSTASGTEMLLHFHSSIVQSAGMTGDAGNTPMVLELPNDSAPIPVSVAGDGNVVQTQVVSTEETVDTEKKSQDVNVKVEQETVGEQQQVVEDVKTDSQDDDEKNDLIDYTALADSHQVVSVEEVQAYPAETEQQVVSMEEVEVSGEVVHDNQVVVVEEVEMPQDDTIIQGEEQVVVQEVEMDGEYVEVPQSQVVVDSHGNQQPLAGRTVVFVSQPQEDVSEEGVSFQMAGDTEEQIVYSQGPPEPVSQEIVTSVTPTKLEKVELDPNQAQEVDASNLPPGTEIVHIVDSNTAMVLEVQSDANTES